MQLLSTLKSTSGIPQTSSSSLLYVIKARIGNGNIDDIPSRTQPIYNRIFNFKLKTSPL